MSNGIEKLNVTGWSMNVSKKNMLFSEEMIQQSLELLKQWEVAFPREDTWVQETFGIPSFMVRLDCIGGRQDQVYEIEERPSGVGVSQVVSPLFRHNLERLSHDWPAYDVVVSGARTSYDDHLHGKKTLTLEEAKDSKSLLLIRAEPNEEMFHGFENRSVSSLKEKGNKSYGVALGLWTEVDTESRLPWKNGFALKPLRGSKSKGVEIWAPGRVNGKSTETRIERTLEKYGRMYCQPLIHPLCSGIEKFPSMIYRVFFGYNVVSTKWECMGGIWMARPNIKIHGATDSVIGPIAFC